MARGWRRGILWLMAGLAVLFYACPGWAQVKLVLDGRTIPSSGALMLMGNGLGMSVALMAEELGVEVDDSAWPVVQLRAGDRVARIEPGQRTAVLDGRSIQLQSAPTVHEGMLFVPLHLVAELAALRVDWNLFAGVLTLERRGGVSAVLDARALDGQGTSSRAGLAASAGLVNRPSPSPFPSPAPSPSPSPFPAPWPAPEPAPPPAPSPAAPEPIPAPALAGSAGRQVSAALLDVRLRTVEGRHELVVMTDAPVEPRAMYLPDPDRLVIDLPDATLSTGWRTMPVDNVVMHQLRVSSEEGGVRLVADLTGPTGYTLLPADGHPGFIVRLNHQLRSLAATPTGGAISLEAVVTGGPVAYQAFALREPWRLVVDLLEVTVPAAFDLPIDSPVVQSGRVSQFRQDAVRVVLELREPINWPQGGVSGIVHPDPDGRLIVLLDTELGRAISAPPRVELSNGLDYVAFSRLGDMELVLVQGRGPLEAEIRRLRDPERIVLDFPGVLVERSLGPLAPAESAVVAAVRAGQATPSTGRVVVETRQVAEHQVVFSEDRTRAVLSVRPSQLGGRTVVVDPGHGGRDPGAIGPGGTQEKDVNLAIALELARYLEQAGARVVLTRDRDVYVDLATRTRLANALQADAFISIHSDAIGAGRTASGTGTFYHPAPGEAPDRSMSGRLGEAVQREVLAAIGLPDRGVRQRAFYVLLHTEMPAVLVEVAFIDNPAEEKLLTDPEFQRRTAAGIAQGVLRFFADAGAPAPRRIAEWESELQQVAAAFLENGDIPANAVMVTPVTALGAVSETVAHTPEF
ncbi:MAG: hypothetical protein BAA04_07190 [Firmicutes bacterium ZCTH02-B6]|nr:MAG: hypothetical protein BAA04_07190 [Firmicutes bacterium ZCTH02-B6]